MPRKQYFLTNEQLKNLAQGDGHYPEKEKYTFSEIARAELGGKLRPYINGKFQNIIFNGSVKLGVISSDKNIYNVSLETFYDVVWKFFPDKIHISMPELSSETPIAAFQTFRNMQIYETYLKGDIFSNKDFSEIADIISNDLSKMKDDYIKYDLVSYPEKVR